MKLNCAFIAIGAVVMACLVGCSKKQTEPEARAAPPATIAISYDPDFADIADRITAEATKHGFTVLSVSEDSDLSTQEVDAIVQCPGGRKTGAKGIPVFTVGVDHVHGGRLAADAIHQALEGHGRVAILDNPENESAIMRAQSFQERLSELNADETVDIQVAAQLPGGNSQAQSYTATQTFLQAQGGLKGIFAINQTAALGARKALGDAGKAGQIVVVVFSDTPDAESDPTVVPDPEGVAGRTVTTIQQFLAGQPVDKEILIPTRLVAP